jgi:NAD(P)-dependent dehydrogenase (short-subunit alcohol dehydrogenase family)
VKGLCEKFGGVVYLTARDVGRGEAAVAKLKELGYKPEFHQLDINEQSSITKLKDHLSQKHGGLDLLVNNAAIAFKVGEFFNLQFEIILDVFRVMLLSHLLNKLKKPSQLTTFQH